jgi:hypothetical protein
LYAVLAFPDVFAKAGVFSPSYWYSDTIWMFVDQFTKQMPGRIFQMAGMLESESMIPLMLAMHDSLRFSGFNENELMKKMVPGGQHNEALWADQFPVAVSWLFDESLFVDQIEEIPIPLFFPNPASDKIYINRNTGPKRYITATVSNLTGVAVQTTSILSENSIDINSLEPGFYLLRLCSDYGCETVRFVKD